VGCTTLYVSVVSVAVIMSGNMKLGVLFELGQLIKVITYGRML
jgi:hypothetical protein